MTKTTSAKQSDIQPVWHFIDAEGEVLGRLASRIAKLLTGKGNPKYTPHINLGDKVVVTNVSKIVVTGNKLLNKVYKSHTGYPGGLKSIRLQKLMDEKPTKALELAVKRMLPKNKLKKIRLTNLYLYEGSEHPHTAQQNKG